MKIIPLSGVNWVKDSTGKLTLQLTAVLGPGQTELQLTTDGSTWFDAGPIKTPYTWTLTVPLPAGFSGIRFNKGGTIIPLVGSNWVKDQNGNLTLQLTASLAAGATVMQGTNDGTTWTDLGPVPTPFQWTTTVPLPAGFSGLRFAQS